MMEIGRIAEDDSAAIEDWFRLRTAWMQEMPGDPGLCRTFHAAALTVPWPDEQEQAYLGTVDGLPVGFYAVTLHEKDNLDVLHRAALIEFSRRRNQRRTTIPSLAFPSTPS